MPFLITLERLRAGLGAAGIAAVGGELLAGAVGFGVALPVTAALVCGTVAAWVTTVSPREQELARATGAERRA